MASVIVDTDVVSYRFKKDSRARLYRPHLVGSTPFISFMTLAELHAWALRYRWSAARREDLARHISQYFVHYADESVCRIWAEVTSVARRRGRPIGEADAWIAATALLLDMPLVTNNADDFAAVDGLSILTAQPEST